MISDVRNVDCMIMMKEFPDDFFDLAIVDPPYGINAANMQMGSNPNRSRNDGFGSAGVSTAVKLKGRLNQGSGKLKNRLLNKSDIGWDNEIPSSEYFEELFRISKNQIIWGGNYFPLPTSRCWVVWDKMQPWENFSQVELAWTSFDMPSKIVRYSNTGGANSEKKIHPTQKPVFIYKWMYRKFCDLKLKLKIWDSHLGSGSNRIAAAECEFDFWASEINKDYFNDEELRFANYQSQQKLFA